MRIGEAHRGSPSPVRVVGCDDGADVGCEDGCATVMDVGSVSFASAWFALVAFAFDSFGTGGGTTGDDSPGPAADGLPARGFVGGGTVGRGTVGGLTACGGALPLDCAGGVIASTRALLRFLRRPGNPVVRLFGRTRRIR
ncbi:MAG: hypothetical protein H6682_04495 [Candidatus Eisenbacteria bacterium]|nr:hypothetical protein [Candidatus Eisenbacteria bacterium]